MKVIEDSGHSSCFQMSDIATSLRSHFNLQHFLQARKKGFLFSNNLESDLFNFMFFSLQCYHHCLRLENTLKELSMGSKSLNCFPIIVGRKPNACESIFSAKENTCHFINSGISTLPIVSTEAEF